LFSFRLNTGCAQKKSAKDNESQTDESRYVRMLWIKKGKAKQKEEEPKSILKDKNCIPERCLVRAHAAIIKSLSCLFAEWQWAGGLAGRVQRAETFIPIYPNTLPSVPKPPRTSRTPS
jgi:hypothetical protein